MPSLIFEFWPTSIRIYVTPALNLRPGLNLVAFFTYIQNFQLSNWSPSWPTLITYEVGEMGLDDIPRQPGPVTAPLSQPNSLTATLTLSTFNLISINYANVWLHTLNVVEGFNVNCIKIYSIVLSLTCHGLRNFPPLIHIPSYPFMNFQNPASYYFLS